MERSNLVRTAANLERKYDFSQLKVLKKNYELNKLGLNKVENEINNFVKATTKHLEELQNQVDGNITTWFYNGVPTIENNPAINWSTENEKVNHLGDLYYDQNTGYAYRWAYENESFVWSKIVDADVVKALAVANAAQDTADKKRQVFIEQPSPPYDVGDLWIKDNELYRCQTTKENEETFENNDWIIATKYTDDTVANQVGNKLTILSGTVTEIRKDVDELNTTMTNTTSLVNEQGKKIGTLETKTSETSQTVDEISASVTKIGKEIIPTRSVSGTSIYIEDGSDNKLIDFEIEGKSIQDGEPTSDKPIEIKSVGTENLFNKNNANILNAVFNEFSVIASSNGKTLYIPIEGGKTYIVSKILSTRFRVATTQELPSVGVNVSGHIDDSSSTSITINTSNDAKYLLVYYYLSTSDTLTEQTILNSIKIKETGNKYRIEVKTVGKNLFDSENWYETLNTIKSDSMQKEIVNGIEYYKFRADAIYDYQYMKGQFKENTQYIITAKARQYDIADQTSTGFIIYYTDGTKNYQYVNRTLEEYDYTLISEINKTIDFISLGYAYNNYVLMRDIMLVEGTDIADYKPYQSNTSVIALNEPLRSLPNEVKDKAYIKNNILHSTRKNQSKIFNGSEAYSIFNYGTNHVNTTIFSTMDLANVIKKTDGTKADDMLSDKFKQEPNTVTTLNLDDDWIMHDIEGRIYFCIENEKATTVEEFKNWLVNNNVEVIYELAEPYTENLGEFEMLSTYENVTHITTTDVLQPVINIQYVRDTTLSEYVEGQIGNAISIQERKFAELEITTDSIQATVSEVSTNLNNNYTPTEELDQILEEQKNIITTEMTTKYQQDMSSFSFEIIKKINEDGVTTLKNTMVSIDEKGIHTAKNNEDVVSLLDNKGVYVSDGPLKDDESNVLMKTDRDGAFFKASNTVGTIKEQDIIQKEKIDDEDFGVCQGWYWIGDEN